MSQLPPDWSSDLRNRPERLAAGPDGADPLLCRMCGGRLANGQSSCPHCGEGDVLAAPERPEYKLYSIEGVMLATFLGSIFAGGLLLAINAFRMGRSAQGWTLAAGSLVIVVGLVLLSALVLPDRMPSFVLLIPQMLAAYAVGNHLQKKEIALHQRSGGALASNWGSAGIAILCALLILAIGIAIAFAIEMAVPGAIVEEG